MALMKYATFLQTVAFVGVPVVVTQEGKDGYSIKATYIKADIENVIEMAESVTVKGQEPEKKIFKSIATIEKTLRDAEIYEFSVKLSKENIAVAVQPPKADKAMDTKPEVKTSDKKADTKAKA